MKNKNQKRSLMSYVKSKKLLNLIILLIIPCFLFCAMMTGCSKVEVESDDESGSGSGTVTVGQPYGIIVDIQDPNMGIGEVIPVTVTVSDVDGNPVGSGFRIDFSVTPSSLGMFTPATYSNTSSAGVALIYFYTMGIGDGMITAQYASGGAWGALSVSITGDPNTVVDPNSIPVPTPNTGTGIIGSINLSKGADSIVADGTQQVAIIANIKDTAGMPMPDNTAVTFTTTAGDIDAGTAGIQDSVNVLSTDGVARTFLRSSLNTGDVIITADCQGYNKSITVEFIPGPTATLTVEAFPDLLIPDGENQSTIIATALDSNGNPVADGTVLTFSASFGELDTLLTTTSKGVVSVTYTAPDSAPPGGTDTITVEAPNETTGNVVISLSGVSGDPNAPSYPVGSITLSSGSAKIVANGSTSLTVSADVRDTLGVSIPDGTPVTFTTTAGDIDPNVLGIQNTVTLSTTNGIARATLRSSTKAGTVTITGESGGFNDSVTVEFIPGPPATVTVEAMPADLTADGTSQSTIIVTVLDAFSNPVSDGTLLTFNAIDGELSKLIGTTSVGVATVTYTAPGYVPAGGADTITAETTNEISGSAAINLSGAQVANITLVAVPDSLPADGTSKADITATVSIVGGGSAPDDTPVLFEIVSGGGTFQLGGGTTTTSYTAGGKAIARLISDVVVGTATIQATSSGITEEIQITYTPGSVALAITPNSLLGTGEETANVIALLTDASGSPVADGEMITFSLSDGTLGNLVDLNGVSITDPNGKATAVTSEGEGKVHVIFQAGEKDGTITITATWSPGGINISGSASATILPSPADIRMASGYPDPMSISIKGTGGIATSRLTFDVTDSHGDPVPDGYRIDFVIQSGPNGGETIVPSSALTEDGQVTTLLRSGTKAGPVSIKAYYYNNSEVSTTTSSIAISAGPPVGEEFSIAAQYRNVSGLWIDGIEDQITIHAGDVSGNAVPDDTAISFKTYNTGGTMVPGSSETTEGVAISTLESSAPYPSEGFLSVTAEATNGGRTTHVTSIAVTPAPDNAIMYAGTDGGGMYKSTDGGYSWATVSRSSTIPGQNWIDPYINDISIDPEDENTVYVATGYLGKGNVYRSLDGGLNWNSDDPEEWNGILNKNKAILTILCDDGSPYVWVGTEGLGALFASNGEDFTWGGIVSPLGPPTGNTQENLDGDYFFDALKGVMTKPTLSCTSKTETWSVTYAKTDVYLDHNPFSLPDERLYLYDSPSGSNADGYMDQMDVEPPADTETWTVTYIGGFNPNDPNIMDLPGKGKLYIISTSATTKSETWTLTYQDPNVDEWANAGFYVRGTASGPGELYSDFTQKYVTENEEVTFFIEQIGQFAEGDLFSFTTTRDSWSVDGDYSGALAKTAQTDVPYDFGGVEFTINSGENAFFKYGDYFQFGTSATGNWVVTATVSGTQNARAYTNYEYTSDNEEVTFTIIKDLLDQPFEAGDEFEFTVIESGLGCGRIVRDIVKASGNGATATLYAATDRGVMKSTDGGLIWNEATSFTGDKITILAVHPNNSNMIYAGTDDNGVWISANGGTNWTQQITGLGKGLGATTPIPNPGNKGNGAMSDVTVDETVLSETWTVICKTEASDSGVFSVAGSRSGSQPDATVGVAYSTGSVSFTIYDGTFDFEIGDTFTFDTVRDPGSKIKDLLVDSVNNKLYAITYFLGALEPHAVGNLYVHDLDAGGTFAAGDWREANQGLPQYDPPDDTTLFAQHVLALDNPTNPGTIYVGGEGINLLRAGTDLATGNLVWESSKSGLTNLIMARMPILFTGECTLDVRENIISGNWVNFTVYIQDKNGNPPVAGTKFVAQHITPEVSYVLADITYPDCYTYQGTFRNPADARTNYPYIFILNVGAEHKVEFTYTPASSALPNPPGTSGSEVKKTYSY